MKKTLPMLLITLLFFVACSSDDDKNSISIKQREYTMNYKDEAQIEASSPSSITYASKSEYVAKVSANGLITAGRVGQTKITLTNEHSTNSVSVTVKPVYNLFPEPIDIVSFNDSKQKVISVFGTPDFENETGIMYNNYHKIYDYMFLFNANNKIKSMAVIIPTLSLPANLANFLLERYQLVRLVGNDALFINEKQDMGVGMTPSTNLSEVLIVYIPTDSSRSVDIGDITDEISEIYLELSK